jgi:hypothetical protein
LERPCDQAGGVDKRSRQTVELRDEQDVSGSVAEDLEGGKQRPSTIEALSTDTGVLDDIDQVPSAPFGVIADRGSLGIETCAAVCLVVGRPLPYPSPHQRATYKGASCVLTAFLGRGATSQRMGWTVYWRWRVAQAQGYFQDFACATRMLPLPIPGRSLPRPA